MLGFFFFFELVFIVQAKAIRHDQFYSVWGTLPYIATQALLPGSTEGGSLWRPSRGGFCQRGSHSQAALVTAMHQGGSPSLLLLPYGESEKKRISIGKGVLRGEIATGLVTIRCSLDGSGVKGNRGNRV